MKGRERQVLEPTVEFVKSFKLTIGNLGKAIVKIGQVESLPDWNRR